MTGLAATFSPNKPASRPRPAVALVVRSQPAAMAVDRHALAYALRFACAMSATTLLLGLAVYLA